MTKIDTESRRKWIGDTRYSVSPAVNDLLNFLDVPGKVFELSRAAVSTFIGSENPLKPKRTLVVVIPGNGGNIHCSKVLDFRT